MLKAAQAAPGGLRECCEKKIPMCFNDPELVRAVDARNEKMRNHWNRTLNHMGDRGVTCGTRLAAKYWSMKMRLLLFASFMAWRFRLARESSQQLKKALAETEAAHFAFASRGLMLSDAFRRWRRWAADLSFQKSVSALLSRNTGPGRVLAVVSSIEEKRQRLLCMEAFLRWRMILRWRSQSPKTSPPPPSLRPQVAQKFPQKEWSNYPSDLFVYYAPICRVFHATFCAIAVAMTWEDLQQATFLNPAPLGLLRIWHLAGPACCCKARMLARGAELRPDPSWWPELARCHLVAQLRSNEPYLALDRIWALLHQRPEQANAATPEGKPMTLAVKKGCRGAAELLRWHGAVLLPGAANAWLYDAAAAGNLRCLELLLLNSAGRPRETPWASPNARPLKHGGTALDAAEARGHGSCAEVLRKVGGRHSMQRAAELARPEMLRQWLQEGADVEERDGSGATPLWLAAKGGAESTGASEQQRSECIQLLLTAQATVDALPITQETPLMRAAQRGSVAHCQLLLQARANVLRKDRRGKSVVEHAKSSAVRELLQREADAGPGEAGSSGEGTDGPTEVFTTYGFSASDWYPGIQ
eukprot:symbB.v1.2.020272.t1/scaffold1692.1/size111236/1